MGPVTTIRGVFDAIHEAKSNAPAFCTNFFPTERKLQGWIDHAELFGESRDGAALFLRKDRDFWHLYFCAATPEQLKRELAALPMLNDSPVVVDLVGQNDAVKNLLTILESQGFQPYRKLCRMARIQPPSSQPSRSSEVPVAYAMREDAPGILNLLCRSFDRYAEQLPMLYELEAAVEHRQILVAKHDGMLAGLLFYESQGLTSTVRYWLVDEKFRAFRLGSALMQSYFAAQKTAKRFVLWVLADNENAIQKYQHYGYVADGLIDHVLANKIIHA